MKNTKRFISSALITLCLAFAQQGLAWQPQKKDDPKPPPQKEPAKIESPDKKKEGQGNDRRGNDKNKDQGKKGKP